MARARRHLHDIGLRAEIAGKADRVGEPLPRLDAQEGRARLGPHAEQGQIGKANLDHASGAIFSQYELNQGVRAYQTSNFADAYTSFSNALNYRPGDTTITYYAGLSAINSKNYEAGIKSYEALTKTNFSANNQIYLDLSRLYSMKGDTIIVHQ